MIGAGFAEALVPPPAMGLAEWSDRFRVLTSEGSAEPGKWRTDRTPYLREIMEALSPASPVTDVWFMKGAQIGATEMGVNLVGFVISQSPGPMLLVEPTEPMAKRVVKQRIDPMIDSVREVASKLPDRYAKTGGNSISEKIYPGGTLIITGANSAPALRSMPVKVLILDETDAYKMDLDGEGDPVQLAKARTRTFRDAKRLYISTPTVRGMSRIEAGYQLSDRRRYFVPCPSCGEFQTIEWGRLRWDKADADSEVWLECEHNGCVVSESSKPGMLRGGEWRPTNEAHGDDLVRGYHLSSLYSPLGWYSWQNARDDFVAAEEKPHLVKAFVNTVLGETYAEAGDAPAWRNLYSRRESYRAGVVPAGGLLLTAGVDVQKDRLEVELRAWGENRESWSVDYLVFPGDTMDVEAKGSPWRELDRLLAQTWPTRIKVDDVEVDGVPMGLRLMAVDSGYNTQSVYQWGRRHDRRRVALVKGRDSLAAPIGAPTHQDVKIDGKRLRRGVMVWTVGVSLLKSDLYASLRREPPTESEGIPSGWIHFPQYGEDYFQQLTAEELGRRVNRRGYIVEEWRKVRDRNEALDCAIYNRAASIIAGLDRMQPEHFEQLRKALVPLDPDEEPPAPRPRRKRAKRREKSIWE